MKTVTNNYGKLKFSHTILLVVFVRNIEIKNYIKKNKNKK